MSKRSEQFEALAKVHLHRNAEYLRSSHDNFTLPMYRDVCLRLAYDAAKDATRSFALSRSYFLRGD